MTQFLDTPVDKSLGSTGSWIDIDLSSDIPVGATGAIFRVYNSYTVQKEYGFRKKGSTDDRHKDFEDKKQCFAFAGVDANRVCQGYIEHTGTDFFLLGYTQSDATFFTNGYDKSLGTTGSWTDIDLSSELPAGAVAAIFEVYNTTTGDYGFRKKGSSDNRTEGIYYGHNWFMVGVDSNRVAQAYISATGVDCYLVGYLSQGQSETTGIDRSVSSSVFGDIDESASAPANATGVFGEVFDTSGYHEYAVRKNGTSFDYYEDVRHHYGFFVGLDADKIWEGRVATVTVDFFVLGYFVPPAVTYVPYPHLSGRDGGIGGRLQGGIGR